MKQIAIITGATGGLGSQFVKQIQEKDNVDEIWVVGRNKKKLEELRKTYGDKLQPMELDLNGEDALKQLQDKLDSSVLIRYLVNNAGVGRMGKSSEFPLEEIGKTIDINCKVPLQLCSCCLPYMKKGSRIINISSASAFQPTPYINLYGASKVLLRHYTRSLHEELRGTGITATAVCPGWIDTELLPREIDGVKVRYPGITSPEKVVAKALKDADKGKDMSVCTWFVKWQHGLVHCMPQKWVMRAWQLFVKKYVK